MQQTQAKTRRTAVIGAVALAGLVAWWAIAASKAEAEEAAPTTLVPGPPAIHSIADLFPAGR
jgi:hypothetical protein